jgi:hypothetical protein
VERLGGEHLAARAIEHVDVPVAIGVDHHLARGALPVEVEQHVLVDAVVVEEIVGIPLVRPRGLPVIGIPREDRRGPLVVAGTHVGIPRSRVGRSVVHEVEVGIVGDESPHGPSTDLPGIAGPALHAEVRLAVGRIERLEPLAQQHLAIGTGAVRAPGDIPVGRVEGGDPPAHAELPAAVAHEDFPLHDQRRHSHRLAAADLAQARAPHLLPCLRVHRDGVIVQGVEVHAAVGVRRAAVHNVAAGDALRRGDGFGLVGPAGRAGIREIERVQDVGIGRDDVHRRTRDDGCSFLAAQHPRGERPRDLQPSHVLRGDLVQTAVSGVRVVAGRHGPLAHGPFTLGRSSGALRERPPPLAAGAERLARGRCTRVGEAGSGLGTRAGERTEDGADCEHSSGHGHHPVCPTATIGRCNGS